MNKNKSKPILLRKSTLIISTLLACQNSLLAAAASDPFQTITTTLESTKTSIDKISLIILGISFVFGAVAGAWFQRWKMAFCVVIAGALVGLGPSIMSWVSSLK